MISKTLTLRNKLGFHAGTLVRLATQARNFESDIVFERDGIKCDGKQFPPLAQMWADCGAQFTVYVNGPDEAEAIKVIEELIEVGFVE